jgi:hypothetical protein
MLQAIVPAQRGPAGRSVPKAAGPVAERSPIRSGRRLVVRYHAKRHPAFPMSAPAITLAGAFVETSPVAPGNEQRDYQGYASRRQMFQLAGVTDAGSARRASRAALSDTVEIRRETIGFSRCWCRGPASQRNLARSMCSWRRSMRASTGQVGGSGQP